MYDILCLSDCCCDLIFQGLPRLPLAGEEEYCRSFSLHAGGGANTPIGLARLGLHTAYATTVGSDLLGGVVWDELTTAGISTDYLQRSAEGSSWVSAVLSTQEDRAFASSAGVSANYSPQELERMIASSSWVHTYVYYCQKYPALPQLCQRLQVPLSVDLSYDPSQTLESLAPLLRSARLITPNRDEALALSASGSVTQALNTLSQVCENVVITMGAEGCAAILDGGRYRVYAPEVTPVDANGAGDLFNAGLLWARLRGMDAGQQLCMACACGSLAVTCVGSMDERFCPANVEALSARVRVARI